MGKKEFAVVQDNIAAQLASSADLLRLWSHRREKRQAAATPPRPAQRSSAADNSDSDSEAPTPARSGDLEDLPMLKVIPACTKVLPMIISHGIMHMSLQALLTCFRLCRAPA